MFRYTNDGNGNRSLKEVSAASRAAAGHFSGTVDVAAADFDGQGKDEVLVGRGMVSRILFWPSRRIRRVAG